MFSRKHTTAAAVLAAALLTGCSHSSSKTSEDDPSPTPEDRTSLQADVLPPGMVRLGPRFPHTAEEAWAVTSGPLKTATVTAHFTLPAKDFADPITIEIGNRDGHRVTYVGDVGN